MYNTSDILARLQNGETMEEIVAQFTDAVNEANATYNKQMEDEAAAQKAAEHEAKLDAAAEGVADAIYNFAKLANPDLDWDNAHRMTSAEVREIMDQMLPLFNLVTSKPKVIRVKAKSADEALTNFFNLFGL